MPIFARTLALALGLAAGLLPLAAAAATPPPGPGAFATPAADPQPDTAPPAGPAVITHGPGPVAAPTVSLGPTSVAEGDEGVTPMVFQGSISFPCAAPVVLTYDIVPWHPNPATPGVDFEAVVDGVVVVPAGATQFSLLTAVHGDLVPEHDERVAAIIHDVQGCAEMPAGQVSALGMILDDDVQHVSIDDVSVIEGDVGTTDMVFTVSLDSPALIDYSVSIGYGPGTATPDVDWVSAPLPSPLVFLVGMQSIEVTVEIIGDTEVEDDETLALSLHHASFGLEIAKSHGTGTIIDDDGESDGDDGGSDGGGDGGSDGSDDGGPDDGGGDGGSDGSDGTEVLDEDQERGSLPRTGATVGGLALLGAALVAGGRAVTAVSRR